MTVGVVETVVIACVVEIPVLLFVDRQEGGREERSPQEDFLQGMY